MLAVIFISALTATGAGGADTGSLAEIDGVSFAPDDAFACAVELAAMRSSLRIAGRASRAIRDSFIRCLDAHRDSLNSTRAAYRKAEATLADMPVPAMRPDDEGVVRGAFKRCVADAIAREGGQNDIDWCIATEREREIDDRDQPRFEHPDAATLRVVWSAQLCNAIEDRAAAIKAIKTEHVYSRRVGVVNLEELEGDKQELREADDAIASTKRMLSGMSARPLACASTDVAVLRRCSAVPAGSERMKSSCAAGDLPLRLRLMVSQ